MVFMQALAGLTAVAGAPPSGEPPRMAPPEAEAGQGNGKAKEPPITLENRQALLAGLYDALAKSPEPGAAKPVTEAIWKVWSFTGSATSDVLIERARTAAAEGGADAAVTYLTAVTELQPDVAHGWFLRAMVFKLNGDSHRALGDLRRALALDPRHFEAVKALAFELHQLNQIKTAREAYDKLIALFPAAPKSGDAIIDALTRDLAGQGI